MYSLNISHSTQNHFANISPYLSGSDNFEKIISFRVILLLSRETEIQTI